MICNKYYKFFETIAHESRWKIIESLMRQPKTVSELVKETKEEQSSVSHNLKKLADCNVVAVEKIGKSRRYSINKETVLPLLEVVGKHVHKYCEVCKC